MEVCFSLVADKPINFKSGTYFKMEIEGLQSSEGSDLYNYNGVFLKDKVIAGLGRVAEYNLYDLVGGMGATEAKGSKTVILYDNMKSIKLKIETNCILDPGLFAHLVNLKIINKDKEKIIPFGLPGIKLNWETRGTYIYDIPTSLIK